MKKTSTIVMALALLMAMTQCKKNESTGDADNTGETVTIMLNVGNDDGSKVIVNPALGTVNFEECDKIYVGSGGKYVGMLTHDGNHHFVGNITNPIDGQPLQFYFLGDVTPQETLSAGITEECSVVISDQTEHLPVISYAPSNENYSSSAYTYTAHLLNKCALVKFNVTTPSTTPIYITGMKNKVTVDFTQNTVTPSMDGDGDIVLCAGNEESFERWVILLPQAALEEGEEGTVHSKYGDYLGIRPAIPAITNNGYHVEGIDLTVNTKNYPEGATNGLFTINASGDQVYFSKGNLQYIENETPHYWKFANNQWSYFEEYQQHYTHDLFAWGTSGYDHGAVCYYPWGRSHNYEDFYAYGNWEYNLYDQTGQADWGYNAISNGGNQENSGWRTPSIQEWEYLFNTRNTISGIRWAQGIVVGGYNGTILLPDNWDTSLYELNDPNGGNFTSNIIEVNDWINILEPNGAIFLPAAGRWHWNVGYSYSGANWSLSYEYFGTRGHYWSSSVSYNMERARIFSFASGDLGFGSGGEYRYDGFSVRLVKNYNP